MAGQEELYTFEGEPVDSFVVKLPAITLESDDPIARDTWMTVQLDVRVKHVRVEEDRQGKLVRDHILQVESAQVIAKSVSRDRLDEIAPVPPHVRES